jgi:hypothetical protein
MAVGLDEPAKRNLVPRLRRGQETARIRIAG